MYQSAKCSCNLHEHWRHLTINTATGTITQSNVIISVPDSRRRPTFLLRLRVFLAARNLAMVMAQKFAMQRGRQTSLHLSDLNTGGLYRQRKQHDQLTGRLYRGLCDLTTSRLGARPGVPATPAVTPEPSSMLMLATGMLVILSTGRNRGKVVLSR